MPGGLGAVLADGGMRCWGRNIDGELGDGTTTNSVVPVAVVGLDEDVVDATATSSTCALLADGRVRCWGKGPLGDGNTEGSTIPVVVGDITGELAHAVAISTGNAHTCVVSAFGGASCWGDNVEGSLGTGDYVDQYSPVDVVSFP